MGNILGFLLILFVTINLQIGFGDVNTWKNARDLQVIISWQERYTKNIPGTFVDHACWLGDQYAILSQDGNDPIITIFDGDQIRQSK